MSSIGTVALGLLSTAAQEIFLLATHVTLIGNSQLV